MSAVQPTSEQRAVIEAPLEPMLVIAGAGSGKTTTMADRVAHLVAENHVRPEEVLGITFTRKAAAELAARIRQKLRHLDGTSGEPTRHWPEGIKEPGAPDPAVTVSALTYHSYANSLVADYGLRLGVERDAVVMGPAQSWQLASRVVESYDGDLAGYAGSAATLVQAVITLCAECSEHLRSPEAVTHWLEQLADRFEALPHRLGAGRDAPGKAGQFLALLRNRAQVADLVQRYQRAKTQRNLIDFGDLVALAARLARDVPEVGQSEREKYRVVLLDEFQDTSHAQLTLFSSLFSDGHPVTAVGDPHQSIYGFRGASAGQLFRFPHVFPRAHGRPAKVLALTVAWRNSLAVLDAANVMSGRLNQAAQQRHAEESWPLVPLQPRPQAQAGEVELARYATEAEEAEAIARSILNRERAADPPGQRSIAVLCRRRSQLPALQQALEEHGIDYEVSGLGGLLGTPEVIDVVSTLRVVSDPGRSDALMRLLTGARWRIGTRDLMALADFSRYLAAVRQGHGVQQRREGETAGSGLSGPEDLAEGVSLVEAIDALAEGHWPHSESIRPLSSSGRSRLLHLASELQGLRRFAGDDLLALITEAERVTCLDIELAARPGRDFHRARRHLDAFQEAVAVFLRSAEEVSLPAFLAWLAVAENEEGGLEPLPTEPAPGAVQLLTIHAAKGLEWDDVYVPGLAAKAFPSDRVQRWTSGSAALPWPLRGDQHDLPQWQPGGGGSGEDQRSWLAALEDFDEAAAEHTVEEERRLAYVAFTRARGFLMLSCAAWTGSAATPREPSVFLEEIRQQLTARFRVSHWLSDAQIPAENPARRQPVRAEWPYDPLCGPRISAAGWVREPGAGRRRALEAAAGRVKDAAARIDGVSLEKVAGWSRRWGSELRQLLERLDADEHRQVRLPGHLAASALVHLSAAPRDVIAQLRRPVPRQPGAHARRGTAFHSWVEEFYAKAGQLDLDETPGVDQELDAELELPRLQEIFRASQWAQRSPAFIEVPVETRIGPVVARCRIDAVFGPRDGGWTLVDWKTGRLPRGEEAWHRAVQLAIYRLAWARLRGVPVNGVLAAFYYVPEDRTVWLDELAPDLAAMTDQDTLERIIERAYRS